MRPPVTLFGAALFAAAAGAAAQRPPAGWAPFIQAFDAYATDDSVVGASVLLMGDGHLLARHDYGFGDRALRQRVDERTIFHWGSGFREIRDGAVALIAR